MENSFEIVYIGYRRKNIKGLTMYIINKLRSLKGNARYLFQVFSGCIVYHM